MLMLDAKMEASVAKNMIKGAPDVMDREFAKCTCADDLITISQYPSLPSCKVL